MDECWFKFNILKKEERKSMGNHNNYRHGSVTRELPLLTFKISVAIMAILITITSSLFIKRIYRQMVKSRADLMFMVFKYVRYWSDSYFNASVRSVRSTQEEFIGFF